VRVGITRVAAPALVRAAPVPRLVTPPRRERERLVYLAHAPERAGEFRHAFRDDVRDPALVVDCAAERRLPCGERGELAAYIPIRPECEYIPCVSATPAQGRRSARTLP
jgi:hypothetical protein